MTEERRRPLVLIIEDDEEWQGSIQDLLRPLGACFEVADCVQQGLEVAEEHPPDSAHPVDLVILDMRIPDCAGEGVSYLAGADLLRLQRAYGVLGRELPIIVFTAYPDFDNCVDAIKAGAYHYLPKLDPREGVLNTRRLYDLCEELLAERDAASQEQTGQPDERWFEEHHQQVRGRHHGKYAAFLDSRELAEPPESVECVELDGVKVLIAESYKALRWAILHDDTLRRLLPLIVFIPEEHEEHAEGGRDA